MTIAIEKINKSQSVSHSKISPLGIGMVAALTFCAPTINSQARTYSASEKKIHIAKLKEVGIIQTMSSVQHKIKNVEFEKPNLEIMEISKNIIKKLSLKNVNLDFVNPSHDGGMIIEFQLKNTYHLIELFNDGDIVLLKRNIDTKKREVFDLDEKSLTQFIAKLS
jgi:hypothetical protein